MALSERHLCLRQQLRAHFVLVQRRVQFSGREGQRLLHVMHQQFTAEGLTRTHALHWPLEESTLSFVPLALVPRTDETLLQQYVYYEFVESLLGRGAQLSPPPPPQQEQQQQQEENEADGRIHLRPLVNGAAAQWQEADAIGHFPFQQVDTETHKLTFSLRAPVSATLRDVVGGGSVHLSGASLFFATNCVLRLCDASQFRGLHIYIPDQAEPLALDYDTLCPGDQRELDLRSLAGRGLLCCVVSHSALTVLFPLNSRCELTLQSLAADCHFDLTHASLEYWANNDAPLQPFRYSLMDCELLELICQWSGSSSGSLSGSGECGGESPSHVTTTLPQHYRSPTRGFETDTRRLALLKSMKVQFAGGRVPRFFIDGELQGVTTRNSETTLVYRNHTLATFHFDAKGSGELRLRLIFEEDSLRVNPLQLYIY